MLNHLANSQRHLLTAQVLLNDRMERAEAAIQKAAETVLALAEPSKSETSDCEISTALTDIIRRWYERHGNGSSGQHPS